MAEYTSVFIMREEKVESLTPAEPFRSSQLVKSLSEAFDLPILKARYIVGNKLNRMLNTQKIQRLCRGVYFPALETVFGAVTPSLCTYTIQRLTHDEDNSLGLPTNKLTDTPCGVSVFLFLCP